MKSIIITQLQNNHIQTIRHYISFNYRLFANENTKKKEKTIGVFK